MDSTRWRQIEELFHAASALEGAERRDFLARACGEDGELESEVLSLLGAEGHGNSLLHAEVSRAAANVVAGQEAAAGERIGTYRVLKPLGRGGMGAVFLAERADDTYHKQVAIKLVRSGFGSEESLRRFRVERQILARLEHAHIARLLDGGTSDSGQPYVVMEYVDGQPLLTYCKERSVPLRGRLELFRQVCEAVQYAHQNLIVHRDIKPGNVLVTKHGVAKLVDFGIAKLLGDDPIASTATQSFERLLTPESASPEQVKGEAISTASDVYSLGALLYELLTGKPPLEFVSRTPAEVERVICGEEPKAPSVRSGNRSLVGDLDTITLTALRKEPERRYGSAAALGEDVRRYLDGYPIEARQEGRLYRAGKFVRRNRIGVGVAGLMTMLLVAFVVTVIKERNAANQERVKAEQVAKFLKQSFEVANPSEARGKQVTARDIVDRGLARIDTELRGQPAVQANLLRTIAEVYLAIGQIPEALGVIDRALVQAKAAGLEETAEMAELIAQKGTILREKGEYKPSRTQFDLALAMLKRVAPRDEGRRASVLNGLGPLLTLMGEYKEAEVMLKEALALRRKVSGNDHPEVGWDLANLARTITDQGRHKDALPVGLEALQFQIRKYGEVHEAVSSAYNRIGVTYYYLRDYTAAADSFRKAIAIGRKLYGSENREIGSNLSGLGSVLFQGRKYADAVKAHRESVGIFRKVYGGAHPVLVQAMGGLAMSLHFSGGHDEEYELAKEAEAMAAPLVGKDSDRYINALSHWGRALVDRGEFAEARKAYEAIYAHQRKKTDATNLVTFDYLNALALTRRMTGDGAGAEQLLREGIRLNEKTTHYVGRAFLAETKVILSACLLSRSDVEEAGKLAREAGQPLSDSAASDELKHQAAFQWGVVLLESGRAAEAEPVLRKAQELARAAWVGKRERGLVDEAYGRCLRKLGRK